ncbi:MAG: His-Xaa-Ser system protein HxsD [Candidatus Adiutrix sp.]|nr:His-Xaa-Ser system protein HxsD [Candidatus Adiutrix sp.]
MEMQGITLSRDFTNAAVLILNKEYYEKEPVFAAANKFTNKYCVGIKPFDEYSIEVSISPKEIDDKNYVFDKTEIINKFSNEVIEQQARYYLQKQFGKIREMIVEQAFYPLEK